MVGKGGKGGYIYFFFLLYSGRKICAPLRQILRVAGYKKNLFQRGLFSRPDETQDAGTAEQAIHAPAAVGITVNLQILELDELPEIGLHRPDAALAHMGKPFLGDAADAVIIRSGEEIDVEIPGPTRELGILEKKIGNELVPHPQKSCRNQRLHASSLPRKKGKEVAPQALTGWCICG